MVERGAYRFNSILEARQGRGFKTRLDQFFVLVVLSQKNCPLSFVSLATVCGSTFFIEAFVYCAPSSFFYSGDCCFRFESSIYALLSGGGCELYRIYKFAGIRERRGG